MAPIRTTTKRTTTALGLLLLLAASLATSLHVSAGGGGVNDAIRGGLMWDKWWVVIEVAEPAGDHPLYPLDGPQAGSATYRCKECHGWDYKGAAGAYGKGSSHYTGIPGVYGSTMTPAEMFDVLKFDTPPNGHGFAGYGMTDQDINDAVEFLQTLVIDTDVYIDESKNFIGDEVQGEINYTVGGSTPCMLCHGPDGTAINFGTPQDPEWVGTIAVGNPWELLHKARFGNPGSPMPSWVAGGASDQGVADIGRYAQLNFPTAPCPADVTGDGTIDVEDLIEVITNWGSICP